MTVKSLTNLILPGSNEYYSIELPYGTCNTSQANASKVVEAPSFLLLETGSRLVVKFTHASCIDATLTINSITNNATTKIRFNGRNTDSNSWKAGDIVEFFYDGTYWVILKAVPENHASMTSEYGLATEGIDGYYGHVKLSNDVLNSTTTHTDGIAAGLGHTHSQYVIKDDISDLLGVKDALVFKGVVNSNTDIPTTHEVGWTYKVGTAGEYLGETCQIGDMIVCITKRASSTQNNTDWEIIQTNEGTVIGPVSSTDNGIALYDGTSGKIIKSNAEYTTNSFYKVSQNYSTANNSYPLLFTNLNGVTSTATRGNRGTLLNNSIYVNPSTGNIHVNSITIGNTTLSEDTLSQIIQFITNNPGFVQGVGSSYNSTTNTVRVSEPGSASV